MEKNKIKYNKIVFGTIIVLILIVVIYIVSVNYQKNDNTSLLRDYKKQSISILNEYKKGHLTNKETSKKLEILSDKVEKEYKLNEENNGLFLLELKLSYVSYELELEEQGYTEIDTYISEIKKINNY